MTVDLRDLSLSEIAALVRADWQPRVNYAAVPYLEAMELLESIDDAYFQDSGRSVVAYFLNNASTWRGETARSVKAELRRRLER